MTEIRDGLKHRIIASLPEGLPATEEQTEQILLQRVHSCSSDADLPEILWSLVCFYNDIKKNELATSLLEMLLEFCPDRERKAACYVALGYIAEQEGRFDFAIHFYSEGLSLCPDDQTTAYFLHNNLGHCLNLQGEYIEAEQLCRKAIEIDSSRANAFENLGISLVGQNDFMGAAWALIEAIRTDATDPRAFHCLERLIEGHPEVATQFAGVLKQLEECKKAGLQ